MHSFIFSSQVVNPQWPYTFWQMNMERTKALRQTSLPNKEMKSRPDAYIYLCLFTPLTVWCQEHIRKSPQQKWHKLPIQWNNLLMVLPPCSLSYCFVLNQIKILICNALCMPEFCLIIICYYKSTFLFPPPPSQLFISLLSRTLRKKVNHFNNLVISFCLHWGGNGVCVCVLNIEDPSYLHRVEVFCHYI